MYGKPFKAWKRDGFVLKLWDTGTRDRRGCTRLGYKFWDGDRLIFKGADFCGSPLHADDSWETVAALLGFLSMRPGDTDREYFDDYRPHQLEWCQSGRAELLGVLASDMRERCDRRRPARR
jgi:hypothetical protein